MFAELLGKEAGYCKGKGGSMHIADPATGNLGANAIVGGSAGIATGAAFSAKQLGNGRVCVCFFGEGALGQGVLYEVMNLAALWKLPVIYVCENNMYNEYTHLFGDDGGRHSGAPGGIWRFPRRAWTGRMCARCTPRPTALVERARARAKARRFCCAIPIATAAITSATSTASTTAPSRKSSSGRPSAIRSSCSAIG